MTRAANLAMEPQSRQLTMPPLTKLLDKKHSRGGSLRVGRVVSEIRNGREDGASTNQTGSLSSLRDDEQRIQQDMIEMLTLKVAKKERENELLRVQQRLVLQQRELDEVRTRYESETEQLRAISAVATAELTDTNQQLQHQVQLLQVQLERMRADGDARNAAALEVKRLREKEQLSARALDRERLCAIEQLQRDARQCVLDRGVLEAKLVAALNQHQVLNDQINQKQAKSQALDESLRAEREIREQLEHRLATSALELEREQRARASATLELERVGHEKLALEEKHRQLSKTVRDASARAVDADKKRLELTRSEDELASQLAHLKRENDELRARRAQMSAQTKHLGAKVAALETTSERLRLELADALGEIESARKCSREYQFRIKQLQEELVFQEKRKRVADTAVPRAIVSETVAAGVTAAADDSPPLLESAEVATRSSSSAPSPAPLQSVTPAATPVPVGTTDTDDDSGVPSWMKD